jgi:hypothetical protein
MDLLRVESVSKKFGGLVANNDVSFTMGNRRSSGSSAPMAQARPPYSTASPATTLPVPEKYGCRT